MCSSPSPLGPYKLISVNKSPERANRLIGVLVDDMKDKYTLIHVGNAETMEIVESLVSEHKPDLLFCASMWTPEESKHILSTAKGILPELRTLALPYGLQVEKGPAATTEFAKEHLDDLIRDLETGRS